MITVSVFSIYNIGKVNKETATLARYYIPLTQALSRLNLSILQQTIHFERLVQLHRQNDVNASAVAREMQQFNAIENEVNQETAAAVELLNKALDDREARVDQITLVRLQPRFNAIEREHQQFHNHILKVLEQWRLGQGTRARVLEEILEEERADVEEQILQVRSDMAHLTRASALSAEQHEAQVLLLNAIVTGLAGLLGLVLAAAFTRSLVRPVQRLVRGTEEVEKGNLDTCVAVTTRDELGKLAASFNHMVVELRLKERIKDTFGKYVDPRIVAQILQDPEFSSSRGEKRLMTVAFMDIEGFTELSEGMTPDALVHILNRYFEVMSGPIRTHNGIIDKYIGDAIMAFWGPPFTDDQEQARWACLTALEQLAHLELFQQELPGLMGIRRGVPRIRARIGMATGYMVVGNIGSEFSKGYTVIGDTVNLGARLESANKYYGTRIMMCEATRQIAHDSIETRELDALRVQGKSEPVRIFELLARKGELDPTTQQLRDRFEAGLTYYRNRQWTKAEACFTDCLHLRPEDPPSQLFLARLQHFQSAPPPEDWDSVWVMTTK
jgi:adenylate cyclase